MIISISLQANSPVSPELARILNQPDYTLLLVIEATQGVFTLIITLDGTEIGSFVLDTADLQALSFNLVPPVLSGTAEVGNMLSVAPGIWLIDPDAGLTSTLQWRRDGIAIPGQTGQTYVIEQADAGSILTCRETVGTASSDTAPRSIV